MQHEALGPARPPAPQEFRAGNSQPGSEKPENAARCHRQRGKRAAPQKPPSSLTAATARARRRAAPPTSPSRQRQAPATRAYAFKSFLRRPHVCDQLIATSRGAGRGLRPLLPSGGPLRARGWGWLRRRRAPSLPPVSFPPTKPAARAGAAAVTAPPCSAGAPAASSRSRGAGGRAPPPPRLRTWRLWPRPPPPRARPLLPDGQEAPFPGGGARCQRAGGRPRGAPRRYMDYLVGSPARGARPARGVGASAGACGRPLIWPLLDC